MDDMQERKNIKKRDSEGSFEEMENTFILRWKLLPPKVYYWQDYLFPLTVWDIKSN